MDFFAIDRPLFFASTKVKAICEIIFFMYNWCSVCDCVYFGLKRILVNPRNQKMMADLF